MEPGMRWCAHNLGQSLGPLGHPFIDTNDFLRRISGVRLKGEVKFHKFDLKEFYMSGLHDDLIKWSSQLVPQQDLTMFKNLCEGILRNHFIRSPLYGQRTWRVKAGGGMGIILSGEIADSSLYVCVEKCFLLLRSTWDRYVIQFYGRFQDDGIIAARCSMVQSVALFSEIRKRAGPFRVECESVSSNSFVFLDVALSKGLDFAE